MSGERIIPFTKKDRRRLKKNLYRQMLTTALYVFALLVLVLAFFWASQSNDMRFWAGAAVVCLAVLAVVAHFDRGNHKLLLRLLRDLRMDKKRVIFGEILHVVSRHKDESLPIQVYTVGAYRFELGELSPVLKRFTQVLPGCNVEVHQCLHSGIVLQIKVLGRV